MDDLSNIGSINDNTWVILENDNQICKTASSDENIGQNQTLKEENILHDDKSIIFHSFTGIIGRMLSKEVINAVNSAQEFEKCDLHHENFEEMKCFTPSLSLKNEIQQVDESERLEGIESIQAYQEMSKRMIEAEQAINKKTKSTSSSFSSSEHEENDLTKQMFNVKDQSLKYNGRTPPVLGATPKENKEQHKDLVAELHKRRNERRERMKQKKIRRMNSKHEKEANWVMEQCKVFLVLAKKCAVPVVVSHLIAVMLGVYLGKSNTNCPSPSVEKVN